MIIRDNSLLHLDFFIYSQYMEIITLEVLQANDYKFGLKYEVNSIKIFIM